MNTPALDILLPLLRCVRCGGSPLRRGPRHQLWPVRFELADEGLRCPQCDSAYPVTEDAIPVMWTEDIQKYVRDQAPPQNTISANMLIYDGISTDYMEWTRQEEALGRRLRAAAEHILGQLGEKAGAHLRHLDFGCGPGHVLNWLSSLGATQFGLDVSLANLRNARRSTGAVVVLGDAAAMPFRDGMFDLVTESSALHHIEDWRAAVREACRVCRGGLIIDSEPSTGQMDWGPLARIVFSMRWPVYKVLSYLDKRMYIFRNLAEARLNYRMAEIHHQPGRGFPLAELEEILAASGCRSEIVSSPGAKLESDPQPNKRQVLLHLLSGHNPWNPACGAFTALAVKDGRAHSGGTS